MYKHVYLRLVFSYFNIHSINNLPKSKFIASKLVKIAICLRPKITKIDFAENLGHRQILLNFQIVLLKLVDICSWKWQVNYDFLILWKKSCWKHHGYKYPLAQVHILIIYQRSQFFEISVQNHSKLDKEIKCVLP